MIDPRDDENYVVLPFILTKQHGGDYETEDFSAGWHLGVLDSKLSMATNSDLIVPTVIMKTSWKAQIDLIAMSYELMVRHSPVEDRPDYSYFTFAPAEFFEKFGL